MNWSIKVHHLLFDKKIRAFALSVDLPIGEYLKLVERHLNNLDIQRGKMLAQKKDIYGRLISDLKDGTVIPPISLALSTSSDVLSFLSVEKLKKNISVKSANYTELEETLNAHLEKGDLNILDGLQRTYCLLSVVDDIHKNPQALKKFNESPIRAEIWLHITTNGLLYKILVLNTGQVKMSLRHQIEILFMPLQEDIINIAKSIEDVDLMFSTYKQQQPSKGLYNYKFGNIVEAFTVFSTGNPIADKTNIVVEELEKMDVLEDLERTKFEKKNIELFTRFLLLLDEILWKYYKEPILDDEGKKLLLTSRDELMNSAPFISGFFAAVGKCRKDKESLRRLDRGRQYLMKILTQSKQNPLNLKIMSQILIVERDRAKRWGEEQRRFFYEAFRELFLSRPDNLLDIWRKAAR